MNTTVQCPGCGQTLAAPPQYSGKRVACPKCKGPVEIPMLVSASPAAGAPTIAFEPGQVTAPVIPLPPGRSAVPPPLPAKPAATAVPPPLSPPVRSSAPWKTDAPPPLPNASRSGAVPAASVSSRAAAPRRSGGRWLAVIVVLGGARGTGGGDWAAWIFLFAPHGLGDDARFLPDDSDVVATIDVKGISNSAAGQKLKTAVTDMFGSALSQMPRDAKLKLDDIGRMTLGVNLRANQAAGVVHLTRPFIEDDLAGKDTLTKKTVGSHQMLIRERVAVCLIDSQTVAFGDEATLQKVLERNGLPKFFDEVSAGLGEANFASSLAIVVSARRAVEAASSAAPMAAPGGLGPELAAMRTIAFQADAASDFRFQLAVVFKDSTTAANFANDAETNLSAAKSSHGLMPVAAAKVLDTVRISSSGSVVRASASIDVDTIASVLEPLKALAHGGLAPTMNGGSSVPTRNSPTRPDFARGPTSVPNSRPSGQPNNAPSPMELARRTQAANDLRQIGVALHGAAAKDGHFPPPAIYDASGKPLLSWRVAILPYLGEEELYKQFRLDEPWDSKANRRLEAKMPSVFRGRGSATSRTTHYLAVVGEGYAFFGQHGRAISEFKDGLSQTILIGPRHRSPRG